MDFKTHNETLVNIDGTHLQGYIEADYNDLCAMFGEPTEGDALKVDAEWMLRFDDGMVATIYNWKNGPNYLGSEGKPVHKITQWNVGGHTKEAHERVQQLIASFNQFLAVVEERS